MQDSLLSATAVETQASGSSTEFLSMLNRLNRVYGPNNASLFAMRAAAAIQRLSSIRAVVLQKLSGRTAMTAIDLTRDLAEGSHENEDGPPCKKVRFDNETSFDDESDGDEAMNDKPAEPGLWSAEEWRTNPAVYGTPSSAVLHTTMTIHVYDLATTKNYDFTLKSNEELRDIMAKVSKDRGRGEDVDKIRFLYKGSRIKPTDTPQSRGVQENATFLVWISQK